jgi:hypothetical protein
LHAGILAANPHDTQPWQFIISANAITVMADRSRHLGTFDPFRREMHLGLGAAIENIVRAAQVFGWNPFVIPVSGQLTLSPGPEPMRVANVILGPSSPMRDPLFEAVPLRHTNRGPYRTRAIARELLRSITAEVESDRVRIVMIDDPGARRELGALIVDATARIIGDPEMSADSARWFRTGRREIETHHDGVATDVSGVSPLLSEAAKLLPDQDPATADQYWLNMTRDVHVGTAPVLGLILVRDRLEMASAIAAGRAWQHLHLMATAAGLVGQPLNQPVECIDRNAMLGRVDVYETALVKLAALPDWKPTFAFRLGYAERTALPSPRRPLDDVVVRRRGQVHGTG